MITTQDVRAEIDELMQGKMSWQSLERLNLLLHVEHRMKCREAAPLDMETAREWTAHMVNSDGSRGPRWSEGETREVMAQRGWRLDEAAFYAVMNSLWSDYGATIQRRGMDSTDLWADLARDWLCDEDARRDKAARYYADIVEH